MTRKNIILLLLAYVAFPAGFNYWLHGKTIVWVYAGMESVPLWGALAMAGDILITAFTLPLITWWVVPLFIRMQLTFGQADPVTEKSHNVLVNHFAGMGNSEAGARLGMITVVTIGIPVVLAMQFSGITTLGFESFLWLACIYTAAMAALVTPFIGWVILRRESAVYL